MEWPTPIGYKNVIRTSIIDSLANPIMSIDREMPWEIKNFDATWSGPEGAGGTIEYRNGGANIYEVVTSPEGNVSFRYNRASGSTTISVAGYSKTLPQRLLPGTSCMGGPDVPIATEAEGINFQGFVCAWDMMYWQAHNMNPNPYAGSASFGSGEYLGYPCKTITVEGGTVFFWQNLCLHATGEASFNVTKLTILDDIENPTVTVVHE